MLWYDEEDRNVDLAEKELLTYTGIQSQDIKSYPVEILLELDDHMHGEGRKPFFLWSWFCCAKTDQQEYEKLTPNYHIWTYEFGSELNPVLVLVHGYRSSSLFFFKMFRFLQSKFHVFVIDLLGMGRSSKPDYTFSAVEDINNYFVCSLEKWREQVGIKHINLVGYGFGAYVISKYSLQYPDVVDKLILLSPFGVEDKDFIFKYPSQIQIRGGGFCERCRARMNQGLH